MSTATDAASLVQHSVIMAAASLRNAGGGALPMGRPMNHQPGSEINKGVIVTVTTGGQTCAADEKQQNWSRANLPMQLAAGDSQD
jgi:hypothetical protein